MAKEQTYSTDDIDLASYLHALGGEVFDIDRSDLKEQVFLFKLTNEQHAAIPRFFDGTGLISALAVSNSRGVLFRLLRRRNNA